MAVRSVVAAVLLLAAALADADGIASSHDFLVMGDWGGKDSRPYTTKTEVAVARQMGILAGEVNAAYSLALGDNFYSSGVQSLHDDRFSETFEDVFTNPSLQNKDHFRVLAGNHDHRGNCSAEIAYSAVSPRWHFPSYYYDFVEQMDSGVRIHHVMIDTVLLTGQSEHPVTGAPLMGSEYTGPRNVEAAEAQLQWIKATIAASTADYLVVAGHYPVWSICEHGPTTWLVNQLKPMLEDAKVSLYFSGHDHCAQYLDEGKGVQYHGVGAAAYHDPSTAHRTSVPAGALKWHHEASLGAFAHVSIGDQGLVVTHYSAHGKKLYEAPPVKPRTAADSIFQV
jgi:tartrate-resistant acid phosphatase type 5